MCLAGLFAWSTAADTPRTALETPPPVRSVALFNGTGLEGWFPFLGDADADPAKTWSVRDGVLRCTGTPAGYLRTTTPFRNYVLRVEWRWPGRPGNNGVLVHVQKKDEVWPKSIECQLQHENAGDFWVIGGAEFAEHRGRWLRRVPKSGASAEKPLGDWNVYRIECREDTITVSVNGVSLNKATACSLREGYIALQSEGAPIEYRNITLTPLDTRSGEGVSTPQP